MADPLLLGVALGWAAATTGAGPLGVGPEDLEPSLLLDGPYDAKL